MLLQRLVDRTQRDEAAEPEFFRDRTLRWQLALTADGDLASEELTDLADPSDKTRKNGTVHPVPHTTRTVGVAPCIGADDIQYVLGWCDDKSKPARVEQCHASFISSTNAWADAYPDETAATAIARFYASGQVAGITRPDTWTSKQLVLISVDGQPVTELPSLRRFWAAEVERRKAKGRRWVAARYFGSRAPLPRPRAAAASTSPVPACAANAYSSIAPAYRDQTRPSAIRPPAAGTRPPPPPPAAGASEGEAGSRAGPGSAAGPGGWFLAGAGCSVPVPGSGPGFLLAEQDPPGATASRCPGSGACGSPAWSRGPSCRLTVVPATPSRRPISRSLTPAARHALARSRSSAPTSGGRPGPACFTSAAGPSRAAAACSVDTYAADSPNTSATRFPENPARRTTVTAKFRITVSDPAYSASTADPTITRHRPPDRSRCRSLGSGMSPSIARVTARMPAPYPLFNNFAAQPPRKTRRPARSPPTPTGDLGPARPNTSRPGGTARSARSPPAARAAGPADQQKEAAMAAAHYPGGLRPHSPGRSPDEAGWLAFLRSLVARGLSGVALVTSDDHPGWSRDRRGAARRGTSRSLAARLRWWRQTSGSVLHLFSTRTASCLHW